MKFLPKTEDQIQRESLLDEGEYSFEIVKAEEKQSKAKNDMIELKVQVFPQDPNRAPWMITDYLLEKFAFKLRHFCGATGLIEKYEAGTLRADDCIGKTGACLVGISVDRKGEYPPSNKITDYLFKAGSASPAPATELEKDDIPF